MSALEGKGFRPTSLRLQCQLFIVGHLFDSSHDGRIRITRLALLLRRVDVCKLKGTPVTWYINGRDMGEALQREDATTWQECAKWDWWRWLQDYTWRLLTSEGDWKEAYFDSAFIQWNPQNWACSCKFDRHFPTDLPTTGNTLPVNRS